MLVAAQACMSKLVLLLQVFEYLTTDLKKYMDRNGKGPNFPLPTQTIKVRSGALAAAAATAPLAAAAATALHAAYTGHV